MTSSGTTATTGNVPYVSASTSTSTTISPSPISVSGSSVGIGTPSPVTALTVGAVGASIPPANFSVLSQTGISAASGNKVVYLFTNGTDNKIDAYDYGASSALPIQVGGNGGNVLLAPSGGNIGIGTTAPTAKLEVSGSIKLSSGSGGTLTFQDGTTQTTAYTGTTCGADYAESVDVTGDRTKYAPGDVLVIDPKAPGKFLKSNEAYSTMAAGIYSTKPGFVGRLHEANDPASANEIPMAMLGRVPTKVTAENGPIQVGDLLVTSSTMGYAMKGMDRSRLTGAVIGKALGALDSGNGTIMVLVTLQ